MIVIKKEIEDYFSGLHFDESSHTYSLEENKLKISVSGIVKKFVRKVDFFSIAKRKDQSQGLPEGTTRKLWKTNNELACAEGNKAHYFAEVHALNRDVKPTDSLENAVAKFWNTLPDHLEVMFVELTMYHKKYMFGGMADVILYNKKTGKFIIVDYKSNKKLFDNYKGKTLKIPFKDLLETNFNKYQLQFSLYQILFEQTGYKVERRLLVWIKRDGTFEMYDTEDYTERLKKYLSKRL
jgi:ATP-dependent exoDNAse (exonuclease V) beta subunit